MLLAIDIDNSSISFGVFNNSDEIYSKFKITTDEKKTSCEYEFLILGLLNHYSVKKELISDCIISSVVPKITAIIDLAIKNIAKVTPLIVGPGIKTGFPIKTDNPSELGSDLVANAAAVVNINRKKQAQKKASLIIDVSSVSTIFALNHAGEFIGGCIIPGVQMSFDALYSQTAQLPVVTLTLPKKVIGKNSNECIRSGVLLGHAIMIDGFIEKFAQEMKEQPQNLLIYATGTYADMLIPLCKNCVIQEDDLTLKGLYYIYENNN